MKVRMRSAAAAAATVLLLATLAGTPETALAQSEGGFQLPVQLVGFPVIIMAVRISNFMKKLAYAVSPRTYTRRARRAAAGEGWELALGPGAAAPDPATVEKLLLGEFGPRVCVYERVCAHYAQRALSAHGHNHLLDWDLVFSKYKSAPPGEKQNYLLSVFLGDMVRSPALCLGLAKRGRSCSAAPHSAVNHVTERPAAAASRRSDAVALRTGHPRHADHPAQVHRRIGARTARQPQVASVAESTQLHSTASRRRS